MMVDFFIYETLSIEQAEALKTFGYALLINDGKIVVIGPEVVQVDGR